MLRETLRASSVVLCLAHMVTDKRVWLGVDAVWPMAGKPVEIYVDNAAEFKSEALARGCAQHGIGLRWRPRHRRTVTQPGRGRRLRAFGPGRPSSRRRVGQPGVRRRDARS